MIIIIFMTILFKKIFFNEYDKLSIVQVDLVIVVSSWRLIYAVFSSFTITIDAIIIVIVLNAVISIVDKYYRASDVFGLMAVSELTFNIVAAIFDCIIVRFNIPSVLYIGKGAIFGVIKSAFRLGFNVYLGIISFVDGSNQLKCVLGATPQAKDSDDIPGGVLFSVSSYKRF